MNKKHGLHNTKFYYTWQSMKQRCSNQKNRSYHCYGGRGIKVCERWYELKNFYEDMYESYYKHLWENQGKETSIERIDSNGNYEPGNCRWATRKEQQNNLRGNALLKVGNRSLNLQQWSELVHISRNTIESRLRYGWLPKDAVYKKIHTHKKRIITVGDLTKSCAEWSRFLHIPVNTLYTRIHMKKDVKKLIKSKLL